MSHKMTAEDAAGLVEASALDVLRLLGPKLGISAQDQLWLVIRPELIEPATAVQFALLCEEHVEEHSEAAHHGSALPRRFLDVANWAAKAIMAAVGDADAARIAAWAAWAAARDARAAVGDAEAEWQCKMLLSLLRGTTNDE